MMRATIATAMRAALNPILIAATTAFLAAMQAIPGASLAQEAEAPAGERPNFVFLFCDNLGYGDVGCFGSTLHRTPHIDRIAREGMRLTSHYSASGVCTPSRAALMTGCYPRRVGLDRTVPDGHVLRPVSPNGLHPDETTIADSLRECGYATACIGKWHLGDQPEFLPTRQGFDLFFGIPYSDDMTPRAGTNWPPLPLMRGERVVEAPVDRDALTRRYTEESIRFLEANRDRPFFLYLPHAMPGSTQRPFASEPFQGRSKNGPYGDSVEEIDWSTGEILSAIERLGIDRKTIVVWTSDNGAPRRTPPQGRNDPLGGWGYTTREGGMRVPCVVRWPGRVPAGAECNELTTLMDWLPTFVALAGATLPADRKIDGHDIRPLLFGEPDARSPYEAFFYYHTDQLHAVRRDRWKLTLVDDAGRLAGQPRLFDVVDDPGETTDRAADHSAIVTELGRRLESARSELGEGERRPDSLRPVGRVERPTPRVLERSTDDDSKKRSPGE